METNREYYIYRHIRPDKNEPFYIGRGTISKKVKTNTVFTRAHTTSYRNKYWHNIVDLNNGEFLVDILITSNDYAFINQKEKEFIKLYGRVDRKTGTLVNLTAGGQGAQDLCLESIRKLRESKLGYKNPFYKKSHTLASRIKMGDSRRGEKNPNYKKCLSEDIKNKMSRSKKSKSVNGKKVINIITKQILKSAKELAIALEIPYSSMRAMLNGSMKNTTKFKYL